MATTRSYGGEGAPLNEQTLGEMVATVTRDVSALLHSEVELAKAELAQQAKKAGVGTGLLGGAGVLGLFALILLCFSASYAIAIGGGVPVWAGFLCVGGLFALVAGGLAVMGIGALSGLGGPDRTVSSVKADVAWLKHPRSPNGSSTTAS